MREIHPFKTVSRKCDFCEVRAYLQSSACTSAGKIFRTHAEVHADSIRHRTRNSHLFLTPLFSSQEKSGIRDGVPLYVRWKSELKHKEEI